MYIVSHEPGCVVLFYFIVLAVPMKEVVLFISTYNHSTTASHAAQA